MTPFTLKSKTEMGIPLQATFHPERGMNMLSYKLGNLEVIDQSTKEVFEKKYAGLGALIGPHFHRRPLHLIPQNIDENIFPHSKYFKNDERPDPFSHGIGRYAPWKVSYTEENFTAKLSGKDLWNGVPLSQLEGQNFEMQFHGMLTPSGLKLKLSAVSDFDSIVGIHYYYTLPSGRAVIFSQVQNAYIIQNEKKQLPSDWNFDKEHNLTYPLDQDTDFTFFPYPDPLLGKIILDTETHKLVTTYHSDSEENSWQLWHPKGASFVCIEPVSSQNPRRPNLTVSSIQIELQIFEKNLC